MSIPKNNHQDFYHSKIAPRRINQDSIRSLFMKKKWSYNRTFIISAASFFSETLTLAK